jgi:two-component system phosphate regulon response regulator OmpR
MSERPHVVVVDDDATIRETIEEYLDLHGIRATTADGGPALRRILEDEKVDIVLLDLNMPEEDGLSLARYLQELPDVGVIMVTAAAETVDRVVGLEMGADDYLTKPFDPRELLARIRSLQRRLGRSTAPAPIEAKEPDGTAARKLVDGEGQELALTSMEFDLLEAFAERPNKVLTRDQLLELAHHRQWDPFDRSIDVRIARIRRKIETDPAKPRLIKTIRGAGYMFVPETDG